MCSGIATMGHACIHCECASGRVYAGCCTRPARCYGSPCGSAPACAPACLRMHAQHTSACACAAGMLRTGTTQHACADGGASPCSPACRKPRRSHLKHLMALAASWNVPEGPMMGVPGRGGMSASPQFLEMQAELMRRQQDTAAQLQARAHLLRAHSLHARASVAGCAAAAASSRVCSGAHCCSCRMHGSAARSCCAARTS
jgi:hypothetical protein